MVSSVFKYTPWNRDFLYKNLLFLVFISNLISQQNALYVKYKLFFFIFENIFVNFGWLVLTDNLAVMRDQFLVKILFVKLM